MSSLQLLLHLILLLNTIAAVGTLLGFNTYVEISAICDTFPHYNDHWIPIRFPLYTNYTYLLRDLDPYLCYNPYVSSYSSYGGGGGPRGPPGYGGYPGSGGYPGTGGSYVGGSSSWGGNGACDSMIMNYAASAVIDLIVGCLTILYALSVLGCYGLGMGANLDLNITSSIVCGLLCLGWIVISIFFTMDVVDLRERSKPYWIAQSLNTMYQRFYSCIYMEMSWDNRNFGVLYASLVLDYVNIVLTALLALAGLYMRGVESRAGTSNSSSRKTRYVGRSPEDGIGGGGGNAHSTSTGTAVVGHQVGRGIATIHSPDLKDMEYIDETELEDTTPKY